MKIIIGLVGEKGGGKETFGDILIKLLPNKRIARVRFSDLLAETLLLWSIPNTRENLQDLAIAMDKQFGEGTLTRAVQERIKKLSADIILLDGVRWMSDAELIRSFPKNYLIYITAPFKLRFERLKKRKQKSDEVTLTFKQFLYEENRKTELDIPKIAKKADFKIENNSTLLEFRGKIKSLPFLT